MRQLKVESACRYPMLAVRLGWLARSSGAAAKHEDDLGLAEHIQEQLRAGLRLLDCKRIDRLLTASHGALIDVSIELPFDQLTQTFRLHDLHAHALCPCNKDDPIIFEQR